MERDETIATIRRGSTDLTMKWLAACGIATLALDVLLTVGLAALDPQYSHTRQYISELGETGRPYAWVFNAWCVVYGVLFAGFAVSLGRGLNSPGVLISSLVNAVSSVVGGAFPCDPGCACQTPAAQAHMLTGYVSLPAIILAPLFAWFAMKGSTSWRGYRTFTLASAVLLMVSIGWLAACHFFGRERVGCAVGMTQRVILGVQYVWLVVVAVRLWRLAGQPPFGTARRPVPSHR